MQNFEILLSFFHFHFAVFVDDHGACGVKHVGAAEKWVGLCYVSSVCVHCVKGKKGACKTSNLPFNFLFNVCVCVHAGNGTCQNEGPGAYKDRGSHQGPVHPWTIMHSQLFCSDSTNIVIHTRVHLIVFFAETQDTTEWPHRG